MVYSPDQENQHIGTVSLVPVTIRLAEDASIILEDGLNEGAEIVATGASLLEEGQTVRRFEGIGK